MRREKYIYNTHSLQFEKYRPSVWRRIGRSVLFLGSVVLVATGLLFMMLEYFPSPKELSLKRELDQMKIKYNGVNEKLDLMGDVLANIQDRDANVHRMLFGMKPIDQDIWNGGVGGHNRYGELVDFKNSGEMLVNTLEKADQIAHQLTLQSISLDSLEKIVLEKEEYIKCIPSIKPVSLDKLKRKIQYLSGYGMRLHPVHKIPKMHYGLDFTAPVGTPVRVTGKGKVVEIKKSKTGYGKSILVDHGFGYTTLYAHLSEIDVQKGQRVEKGEKIGEVGSTGTSTAPHLHYEVRFNKKPINPIHFCMDGLTPEEYKELVEMAAQSNKSLD